MKSNPTDPLPGADFFPHAPLCFKGCCPDGVTGCHKAVVACSSDATAGTTANFTVVAVAGVTDKSTNGVGGQVEGGASAGPAGSMGGGMFLVIIIAVAAVVLVAVLVIVYCLCCRK